LVEGAKVRDLTKRLRKMLEVLFKREAKLKQNKFLQNPIKGFP